MMLSITKSKGDMTFPTEQSTKVNSTLKISSKAMEPYIFQMEVFSIKAVGIVTSFMDTAFLTIFNRNLIRPKPSLSK
jgi:hypothetical protein